MAEEPKKRGGPPITKVPEAKANEQIIRLTLRTVAGQEYHLEKPESEVQKILRAHESLLIEISASGPVKHRFISTAQIAVLDIHDEMEIE